MRSGCGYGSGFSSTVLMTEKMAVLAPMPRASTETAVTVNPGLCRSMRSECLRSATKTSPMWGRLPHRTLDDVTERKVGLGLRLIFRHSSPVAPIDVDRVLGH